MNINVASGSLWHDVLHCVCKFVGFTPHMFCEPYFIALFLCVYFLSRIISFFLCVRVFYHQLVLFMCLCLEGSVLNVYSVP